MSFQPIIFENITIEIPYNYIYNRLGYRKGKTDLDNKEKHKYDEIIEMASSIIDLKACARREILAENSGEKISFKNGFSFKSKNLSRFLKDSIEVVFMGATAGKEIMDKIKEFENEDFEKSIIFDAVASEMTDSCLDWLMDYFNQLLRREGKILSTNRFSAGYGDFDLKNQKVIYDFLDMRKIGVDITENHILIPEKSVTAIAGVKPLA